MDVRAEGHILGCLDRKTAVGVDGSFRPACRPGGIDNHQRIFGAGYFCHRGSGLSLYDLIPGMVATFDKVKGDARIPEDDDDAGHLAPGLLPHRPPVS